jgi:signal transduction histidine kinase
MDSFPGPLGQVVINLITNAINHGFDGLDSGTIRITAVRQSDSSVKVSIEDDGVGIPTEHLGQIFDPFLPPSWVVAAQGWGFRFRIE